MTPRQFDRAEFVEGWRYELINGVLVVSSTPSLNERDPNQALGRWLLNYQETHPQGSALDFTIHEHTVVTGRNRRRADRVIWAGLGRLPRPDDVPSVVAEFVSAGKRNLIRDYEAKRDEYLASGVQEYWVIDRFQRTLTVFTRHGRRTRKRVFHEDEVYVTDLLPGFELPLARLFALANRWQEEA
jgi:Uma2 family endonuclease